MMKYVLLMCIILCMPSVIGATTQTHILYPTDSIHFQGYNIYVEANTGYNLLRVQIDDHIDFLETGFSSAQMDALLDSSTNHEYSSSSPRVKYGPLTISLQKICADITEPNCARTNSNTIWTEPGYELFFSLEESDVKVTRQLDKSESWLGEDVTLDIEIENNGDVEITDFELLESFPLGIAVKEHSNWESENNKYSYTLNKLAPGETKTVSLSFKLTERGDYSLKGVFSYKSQGVLKEDLTSAESISIIDVYTVDFSTDKESYEIGETGTATITLTPQIADAFFVDLDLLIPQGMSVKKSDLEQSNSRLEESIHLDEKQQFTFDFIADEGEYDFSLFTNATSDVSLPVKVNSQSVTFGSPTDELAPDELRLRLASSQDNILEGEPVRVELFMAGSDKTDFSDISLNLSISANSTSSESTFYVSELDAMNKNIFFIFTPGVLNNTRQEELVISGSYMYTDEDGAKLSKNISASKLLDVYIPSDALKVTRSVSPNPVEQNTTTTVEVSIENLLDERSFSIFAKDVIPPDLLFKSVRTSTELTLRGGEKKLLYSYQLLMPFYIPNSSVITTQVYSENFSYAESSELDSFVVLKEPSLTVSSSWSSLVAGKPSELQISITNTGDLKMNRVSLSAPLFSFVDLVSSQDVFIPDLDPGESATLFMDYFVKSPVKEESLITSILAIDEYGNRFSLDDAKITFESTQGSGCGVIGSLQADSVSNQTYVMLVSLDNSCASPANITVADPSLFISLGGSESRTIQFSEKIRGDYFPGIPFSYVQGGDLRLTKTNDVDLANVSVLDTDEESSTDSSSSSSGSSEKKPSSEQLALDDISALDGLGKKLFGVFAIIVFVFIFMAVLLKVAQKKSHETKKPDDEVLDDSLVPPSIKEGLESVGLFVDESIKRGVPKIKIEEQLHYVGWSKDIIDKYLGGRE